MDLLFAPAPAVGFPRGELPPPESPARRWAIRASALVALAATAAYLAWRALVTVEWRFWWLALPLEDPAARPQDSGAIGRPGTTATS